MRLKRIHALYNSISGGKIIKDDNEREVLRVNTHVGLWFADEHKIFVKVIEHVTFKWFIRFHADIYCNKINLYQLLEKIHF